MESDRAGTAVTEERDREAAMGRADKLDMRLWIRMLTCATMVEREIRSRMRTRFDTTLPRYDVLAQLYRNPEGMRMGDLSSYLMVSNGNVTVLIERLLQDGLVSRAPAGHDRRSLHVRLTGQGRAQFEAMTAELNAWIAEFFGHYRREDKDRMLAELALFKQALRLSPAFVTGNGT